MEDNMTTYELEILNLNIPSFDKIRSIAYKQLKANFSHQEIEDMFGELKRGTSVIDREELLWNYLYSFGNKHQAKIHACLLYTSNTAPAVLRMPYVKNSIKHNLRSLLLRC